MKKVLACIVFVCAFSSAGFATSFGVDFLSPGYVLGPSVWSLGFKFQANANAVVTRLGVFDAFQDGLVGTQQVGLWDTQGNLLAATYVDNSDSLEGNWRFHAINNVTLTQGSTYFVASQGGEFFTFMTSGFTVNPYITYIQDSWSYRASLANSPLAKGNRSTGISSLQGGGYFGANLDFGSSAIQPQQLPPGPDVNPAPTDPQTVPDPSTAAVPEPGSIVLLGIGLAGLLAKSRRREL